MSRGWALDFVEGKSPKKKAVKKTRKTARRTSKKKAKKAYPFEGACHNFMNGK